MLMVYLKRPANCSVWLEEGSIELITWLSTMYTTGILDMPVQKLFSIVLVNICKMLCDYKWQADK